MLVSVIIPYSNPKEKILRSLNSVFNQTCSDLEVLVIDDASDRPFGYNQDPRVRVIRNAVRKGPAGCRNIGMAHSKGRYFAFLDPDDYWSPEFLEKTTAALLENPAVCMACANGYEVNEKEEKLRIHRDETKELTTILPDILTSGRQWRTSGSLWRREAVENLRWPDFHPRFDYAFDMAVAVEYNRIAGLKDPLVFYDMDGADKSLDENRMLAQKLVVLQYISDTLYASKWRKDREVLMGIRYVFLTSFKDYTNQQDLKTLARIFRRWNGLLGKLQLSILLRLPESTRDDFLELITGVYKNRGR